jgi:nitric oxide reductase subunit B
MIAGFSVLTVVTVLTYTNAPPIPERVADVMGTVLFTGADIQMGQEVFLKYGLMEHGSLWGHGAYLGPDYSAEYLHRLSEATLDTIAAEKYGKPFAQLSPDERSVASARTMTALKENRYDPASRTLRFSPGEVAAYRTQLPEWSDYFTRKDAAPGLPANYIRNPAELKSLTAYLAWAAWATVAHRPGKDYSYTNNWPYEPLAGNRPSTEAYVWSALSLITLLGGGLFLASWVGGTEPKHQKAGVYALLGALVVVVAGSLAGESLGINDKLGRLWFWFGHQGSEYLDLGRVWQFMLAVGLLFWLFLMFRALKPAFKSPDKRELSSLFLYAAVAIPVFSQSGADPRSVHSSARTVFRNPLSVSTDWCATSNSDAMIRRGFREHLVHLGYVSFRLHRHCLLGSGYRLGLWLRIASAASS